MRPIILSGVLTASNTDLLSGTRLSSMPRNGQLILEFQASANSAANNGALTLQLPNGDNPMDGVNIAAGVTAGAINADDKMIASYAVGQGGAVQIGVAVTGTVTIAYRITLR